MLPSISTSKTSAVAQFLARFAVLEADTNATLAERTRRMAGATPMMVTSKTYNRWYRIPEPADGCPPLGPLALTWEDLFNRAKSALQALASLRPPRYTPGRDVVRWFRAMRWNLILLLDATNIRPVFRFPTDFPSEPMGVDSFGDNRDEWRRGDVTTLFTRTGRGGAEIVEGKPYPKGGFTEGGVPTAVQDLGTIPNLASSAGRYFTTGYVLPDVTAPVWFTALDQSADVSPQWFNPLDQLPGPAPGSVIDQNPADISSWQSRNCFSRSYAEAFDEFWTTQQPVKIATCDGNYPIFVDLGAWIDRYVAVAVAYGALDLPTMLLKSIGWYVNNHLVYWRNKGMISLDDAAVERMRDAVNSRAVRAGLAPAYLVSSLASTINPIAGAVIGMVTQIGFDLLDVFIIQALERDTPRRLFIRSYPASCNGVEAEDDLTLANEEAAITGALSEQLRQEQAAREAAAAALEADREALHRDSERRRSAQAFPWLPILGGTGAALLLVAALRGRA